MQGHLKSFLPIGYISAASLIIYIAGLTGFIDAGVYLVMVLSAFLLAFIIVAIIKKNVTVRSLLLTPATIFFFTAVIWLWWATRNAPVIHVDDFSHWFKICKIMYYDHAFPTTRDLSFPSYTPGTASWIYLINRIIGFSAGNSFFAQGLINIAALTSLFSLTSNLKGKEKFFADLFLAASSLVLCSVTVSTYVLLVDVTLGLASAALYIMILHEETTGFPRRLIICTLSTYIILIKSSGILFIVSGVVLIGVLRRKEQLKTHLATTLCILVPSLILHALYLARNKSYYGDLGKTKQGLSTARFLAEFNAKSPEVISGTIKNFIKSILLIGDVPSNQVLISWLAILGLLILYFISQRNKTSLSSQNKTVLIFGVIILLSFWASLLAVYLFSMNEWEANSEFLASFDRYNGTITIIMLALLIRQLVKNVAQIKKGTIQNTVFVITSTTILAIGIIFFNFTYLLGSRKYVCDGALFTSGPWDLCEEQLPDITSYNDLRYMVIYDESVFDNDFRNKLEWMMIERLRSIHMRFIEVNEVLNGTVSDDDLNYVNKCDYIVVFGDNNIEDLVKSRFSPLTYTYLNDLR